VKRSLLVGRAELNVWLRPEAFAQIEFLEWTEADRLRHSKFVGLGEDKNPRNVVKEQAGEPRITSG
jgi:ATP-dependent DNA ligase